MLKPDVQDSPLICIDSYRCPQNTSEITSCLIHLFLQVCIRFCMCADTEYIDYLINGPITECLSKLQHMAATGPTHQPAYNTATHDIACSILQPAFSLVDSLSVGFSTQYSTSISSALSTAMKHIISLEQQVLSVTCQPHQQSVTGSVTPGVMLRSVIWHGLRSSNTHVRVQAVHVLQVGHNDCSTASCTVILNGHHVTHVLPMKVFCYLRISWPFSTCSNSSVFMHSVSPSANDTCSACRQHWQHHSLFFIFHPPFKDCHNPLLCVQYAS